MRRILGLAAVSFLSLAGSASAATTYTVDPSLGDTTATSTCAHPCALRQAIADAATASSPVTIEVPAGTYVLTQGELLVNAAGGRQIDIVGEGARASDVTLDQQSTTSSRVIDVEGSGSAELQDLEVTGGNVIGGGGGGILVEAGVALNLSSAVVSGNSASVEGGGIDTAGELVISDSLISGNTAGTNGNGGGISADGSPAEVSLNDSTVADNSAGQEGGGLYDNGAGSFTVAQATIGGNQATETGAGLAAGSGHITLGGSILENSAGSFTTGGPNCSGSAVTSSSGGNVSDDGSCSLSGSGDLSSSSAGLAVANGAPALADNGGPTDTIALQPASTAIDHDSGSNCDPTDQRGANRPDTDADDAGGTNCDAGAFESGLHPPTVLTGGSSSVDNANEIVDGTVGPNGEASEFFVQYSPDAGFSGSYTLESPLYAAGDGGGTLPVSAQLHDLTASTLYDYRIVAHNADGTTFGKNAQFTTAASSSGGGGTPGAVTGGTEGVTDQSATILGTVDPAGQSCDYQFEWGPTATYGKQTPEASAGSADTFSAGYQLTGLTGGTQYHYRIDAICGATTFHGGDMQFTTLGPTVTTGAARAVTETSADLGGHVSSNATGVSYYFEYGTSPAYGSRTVSASVTCTACAAGGDGSDILSGLTPGTTYHYRFVASNSSGTSYGADETFTTVAPPPTIYGDNSGGITSSTAELTGSATANGVAGATEQVDYATDANYNAGAADPYGGSHTTPVAFPSDGVITIPLSGLAGNTEYHYAVVIVDASGTTVSPDQTFTTNPNGAITATVEPASGVSSSGLTLNASINDQNTEMVVGFNYTISATSCSGASVTQSGQVGATGSATYTLPASNSVQQIASDPVSLTGYPGLGLAGITVSYSMYYYNALGVQRNGSTASGTAEIPQIVSTSTPVATIIDATDVELTATVGTFPSDATPTQGEVGIFEVTPSLPFADSDQVNFSGDPLNSSCAEPISATATGLSPDTTYHYRLDQVVVNLPGFFGSVNPNLHDPTDIFGAPQTFTTPATNPPTNTTVTSSGNGQTTLQCPDPVKCSGSFSIFGVDTLSLSPDLTSAAAKSTAKTRTIDVLLARVGFKIAAGQSKTLHFRLTRTGRRFLRTHRHAQVVAQVTSRAGHRKKVTTRYPVHI